MWGEPPEDYGWERWLDEVGSWCMKLDPNWGKRDFTEAEYEQLGKLRDDEYSSLSAAEAICGIE